MALILTIKAAFDITDTQELDEIRHCISGALDALREQGAARVESATFDAEATVVDFVRLKCGLSEVEFELPTPTIARIEFD